MIQNKLKLGLSSVLLFSTSFSANSITLDRGTETHLNGTLGDVQVNYVDDNASLTGYLSSGGLVTNATPIPIKRVQYDLLNNIGNGSIFTFRVDYTPGTTVIGAADPQGFYQGDGIKQTYWGGIAYTTLFDSGFGVYDYNATGFGGEWTIDYQPDHVTWNQLGNGFFNDTATGLTNFGFNPSFSLAFAPDTILGLMPAEVTGRAVTGAPVLANGRVLSSVVPVPAAVWLFGSGLIGLIGVARRKKA